MTMPPIAANEGNAQDVVYPLVERGHMVDMGQVRAWFDAVFRHADWEENPYISILGIGEKGTPQEGKFRERKFIDMRSPFAFKQIETHLQRWAQHHIAAFAVPAILKPEAVEADDVTLERIAALTAIILDVDSGDTPKKIAHAEKAMGNLTFGVKSGGLTPDGYPKIHAYWLLSEPCEEFERVAALRKELAARCGGDQAFGRATQVIRIPGSVYAKGGPARMVELVLDPSAAEINGKDEYHLDDLSDAIEVMPVMEGVAKTVAPLGGSSGMDFSGGAGRAYGSHAIEAMQRDVHEGGDEDRNRWGEFSSVAGFNIRQVRLGLMDLQEACEATHGWMLAHMVPPWPRERFLAEWAGIVNTDRKHKGEITQAPKPGEGITVTPMEKIDTTEDLLSWAVHRRSSPEPKPRRILVDGLVFAGKRHMIVAEGGAGKTFLCMDLALKLAAAGTDGEALTWMGQRILPEADGGTVIIMTGEDDAEELDIRWNAIDPDGRLRGRAGDRLIALPLDNLGGAFPLVSSHPATREPVASERWAKLYAAMRGIEERGGKVTAVIIDTLNSTLHGEENSAMVIGEYVRAVAPICGELKAALMVTHHVRKMGAEPIKTLDDMREAIRGSTALPNAMRLVMGFWHAHDYEKRMKMMGIHPERGMLFRGGVLKANMPEALRKPKTLLRLPNGLLEDVTPQDVSARGATSEHEAWLAWCIRLAADYQAPFSRTGDNSLYNRRAILPPVFHEMKRDTELNALIDRMLSLGALTLKQAVGAGKGHKYLDVAGRDQFKLALGPDRVLSAEKLGWADHYYDHGWDEIRAMDTG